MLPDVDNAHALTNGICAFFVRKCSGDKTCFLSAAYTAKVSIEPGRQAEA